MPTRPAAARRPRRRTGGPSHPAPAPPATSQPSPPHPSPSARSLLLMRMMRGWCSPSAVDVKQRGSSRSKQNQGKYLPPCLSRYWMALSLCCVWLCIVNRNSWAASPSPAYVRGNAGVHSRTHTRPPSASSFRLAHLVTWCAFEEEE